MIATLAGGIGLFLLGMILLTDGLKSAAGDALRRLLTRMTGGRLRALFSGAAVTALVQSSSATTLTTIGFVSAGLLTFPQAVGVIFGANLGTTGTGWLVSVVGFKLKIGALALPLIGAGALLRLMARGRAAAIGLALAGFGLLFVGIDTLQAGMSSLATRLDSSSLPGSTTGGRLLLVTTGIAMTVVMQSSSAALATTLAALHGGTIALEQGALLVIGQNVGTTVTAGFAAIGASVPARRTAVAHIAFNVIAGIIAFAMLPLLLRAADAIDGEGGSAVTLAAFHTVFNVVGVAVLLPVVHRFSALIVRLIPDRGPALTRHLDQSLTRLVPVALEAASRTLREILGVAAAATAELLDGRPLSTGRRQEVDAAIDALGEARRFLGGVHSAPESPAEHDRHVSLIHAADHLAHLLGLSRARDVSASTNIEAALHPAAADVAGALRAVEAWLGAAHGAVAPELASVAERLGEIRADHRRSVLARTARGQEAPEAADRELESARWLEGVARHVWRAVHHLSNGPSTGSAIDMGARGAMADAIDGGERTTS